jgi:hypothetical protein
MKWFGKSDKTDKEEAGNPADESLENFEEVLDRSIREEKTQVIMSRKQESRAKAMVRCLLDSGYSLSEINTLLKSQKNYQLEDGEIKEL